MPTKLYVGGLAYQTTEETLRKHFEPFGEVVSVAIITDRDTGKSKGFGFVELEGEEASQKAIAELHDQELEGRKLTVNPARPRKERSDFGGSY